MAIARLIEPSESLVLTSMKQNKVMDTARSWSDMGRDFGSMVVLIFVALGVAWLGDPLRDEDLRTDTEPVKSGRTASGG